MRSHIATLAASAALGLDLTGAALADPVDDTLTVTTEDGDLPMVTMTVAPDHLTGVLSTLYSGWHYREGETRGLQCDDFDNPGTVLPIAASTPGTPRPGS